MTDPLLVFLNARLNEDERIALAASGEWGREAQVAEHWRWVDSASGKPVDVGQAIAANEEMLDSAAPVALRSAETYPTAFVGPLPHFVINAEEISPLVARHVARHDPARVLREVAAKRKIINEHAAVTRLAESSPNRNLASSAGTGSRCSGPSPPPGVIIPSTARTGSRSGRCESH